MKPIVFGPTTELAMIAVTALLLLIIIGLGIRQRLLLQIGLRNMLRRRKQSALLMSGLVLSSAFITASLGLNDSLTNASNVRLLNSLGSLDETITGTFNAEQSASYLAMIRQNQHVRAATGLLESYQTTTIASPLTGFSQDHLNVIAVPKDFDQVFGQAKDSTGRPVRFADLQDGDIYLGATLAQNFAANVDDQLTLTLSGRRVTGRVRAILGSDIALNANDILLGNPNLIVMPLSSYQQITQQSGTVNTLAIRNVNQASDSPQMSRFLQQLFHVRDDTWKKLTSTPNYITRQLHVLNPDLIYYLGPQSFTNGLGAQGALQFTQLVPALTILLVGTGMLLLALQFILLATERRTELGISRALGFQRSHVVQSLLIEGGGYGLIASLLGVLVGSGLVALELLLLSAIPLQTTNLESTSTTSMHLSLQVWIDWHSLLLSFCLSILTTIVVVGCTATWISHTNIVTAIRNLDEPAKNQRPLLREIQAMLKPTGTSAWERLGRCGMTLGALLLGLFTRGPLCLLMAGLLLWVATLPNLGWISQVGMALAIAATGLILGWLVRSVLSALKVPSNVLASRLSLSLIGIGWLAYSIQPGGALFTIFQPTTGTMLFRNAGSNSLSTSALTIVLTNLLLVVGAVVLIMANGDVLVTMITALTSRIRGLASISRTSLVYTLTYRFRTTVTVSLLGMIVFLIMLVVTINVGSIQQADVATTTGGFQLQVNTQALPANFSQQIQANRTLERDIQESVTIHTMNNSTNKLNVLQKQLLLPSQQPYSLEATLAGMSDNFFSDTKMPLQARAQGYGSNSAVWDAVRTHPGYAVWRYETTVTGLNPNQGNFQPFTIQVPDSSGHTHTLRIIGIVSATTNWPYLYVSERTLADIYGANPQLTNHYSCLLRLRTGVSEERATQDLMHAFGLTYNLQVQSLTSSIQTATQSHLTVFYSCYLTLGLIFGTLALGVIMSRAVIERRQHIGMMRAFGFSRGLVMMSFLLEAGFIVTLSLLVGTALAIWSAYKITNTQSADFSVPLSLIALILLGCYLIAFAATAIPARQAARVYPSEALRYE
ncbi:hypothetical protein KSD_00600 [Ktedonobacter sp. SOSP1-85]|uniref:ABC transporter permease n=1 Tax=Ktedonobacter sp. SOSP1-85 TaxID=2778367 RepID=UPI001915A4DA|nr:FtsX-like permease family protein [Ktedonobacter sp. SOSP1-85]GHO72289.1 hypothetical protein KSD_00600 [Ktedonobacter sp. SOSP1-85]